MEFADWLILGIFLFTLIYISIRLKGKASKDLTSFFLGGRNLPWWIAGISMVATTFAADTPLWVAEQIAQKGISANWLWWNMLLGGMLTTFFFSKYWHRAGILTELELIELRYGGKASSFLRGFKSVYMGIFLNCIVIGWVNSAMIKILHVFFEIPQQDLYYWIFLAMLFVAVYSSISGLLGVAITDAIQFTLAMIGCIILAICVLNTEEVGGISGLKAQLPAWRLNFFPEIGGESAVETYSLSIGAFLTFGLVQWWASWYPGAEPGGGGYIAQRMMSTKSERDSIFATLFFQIAHYCLRPWPWIIVGLCALLLYPNLPQEQAGEGFVMAMKDHLPTGLKGMLFASFVAAYMSTISTQLNWGASYLTNDLYKRYIRPENTFESEEKAQKNYIVIARVFTLLIMLIAALATTQITTIDGAAKFLIKCGAGLGLVLILRWYWWRINVWSEIIATIFPILLVPFLSGLELAYYEELLIIVFSTTLVWIIGTFLTPAENDKVLSNFYQIVRPAGWWGKYTKTNNETPIIYLWLCWLLSIVLAYSILFGVGRLIFQEYVEALIYMSIAAIATLFLLRISKRHKLFK